MSDGDYARLMESRVTQMSQALRKALARVAELEAENAELRKGNVTRTVMRPDLVLRDPDDEPRGRSDGQAIEPTKGEP